VLEGTGSIGALGPRVFSSIWLWPEEDAVVSHFLWSGSDQFWFWFGII
jgi:hypothetical protein